MKQLSVTVINEVGLHARPASVFVRECARFKSKIRVHNATTDNKWVDGKSILGVLTLGIEKGHQVGMEIEGPDEEEAATVLAGLIENDFKDKL